MSAVIAKNELTASKRRCDLIVYADAGGLADRGTDFMALGILYVCGATSPAYATGLGTCTNKRRPLAFTPFTFTADSTTDKLTKTTHGLETGDGAVSVSNAGGGLPAPLTAGTIYYVIKFDANTFYLATSLANAYAGTHIDITTNGTGTQTLTAGASGPPTTACTRGLDGYFTYEFTQAETNVDVSELSVLIEGAFAGFSRANGGGTYTTVNMGTAVKGFDDLGEGAKTYGDLMRGCVSILGGKSSGYNTGTIVFRDLADSKNRWTFTVDATGRLTSVANDLT